MRLLKLFIGWDELTQHEVRELGLQEFTDLEPSKPQLWEVFQISWGSEYDGHAITFLVRMKKEKGA
jgi:hypothetical protein